MARKFFGKEVLWQGGSLARRFFGKEVLWQGGSLVRRFFGKEVLWQGGSLTRKLFGKEFREKIFATFTFPLANLYRERTFFLVKSTEI